jgi:hypothetical protein
VRCRGIKLNDDRLLKIKHLLSVKAEKALSRQSCNTHFLRVASCAVACTLQPLVDKEYDRTTYSQVGDSDTFWFLPDPSICGPKLSPGFERRYLSTGNPTWRCTRYCTSAIGETIWKKWPRFVVHLQQFVLPAHTYKRRDGLLDQWYYDFPPAPQRQYDHPMLSVWEQVLKMRTPSLYLSVKIANAPAWSCIAVCNSIS